MRSLRMGLVVTLVGGLALPVGLASGCGEKKKPEPEPDYGSMGMQIKWRPKYGRGRLPVKARARVGPRLEQLWAVGGLEVPESVLFDAGRKVLYVSCIDCWWERREQWPACRPLVVGGRSVWPDIGRAGRVFSWGE